ncbi:MAG: molybdopterin-guanine dinucleotide biosynthesis protein MobB [Gammaproteobacteria bacterium]|nr:molybdopterin-guanine dinucleotide biosynthesis protein MobB [Gammaproteobacteria bacterium]MDH5651027.1 molybdopterin-guanine dinucleotide biosynthesis protein MobB [Gammaproteobacteria bacterium]
MTISTACPLLGFAAWSGTGKTTLLTQLIPLLKAKGLAIGMIKHAHHQFDIDKPGKDSYELRKAGAEQMLIVSKNRWALMVETPGLYDDPPLDEMVAQLDQDKLDLILVEGFKHAAFAKIELHRPIIGKPLLYPADPSIIAIASDTVDRINTDLPLLDINNPASIAEFILQFIDNFHHARDNVTAG